jgi:hypothetical protein
MDFSSIQIRTRNKNKVLLEKEKNRNHNIEIKCQKINGKMRKSQFMAKKAL